MDRQPLVWNHPVLNTKVKCNTNGDIEVTVKLAGFSHTTYTSFSDYSEDAWEVGVAEAEINLKLENIDLTVRQNEDG